MASLDIQVIAQQLVDELNDEVTASKLRIEGVNLLYERIMREITALQQAAINAQQQAGIPAQQPVAPPQGDASVGQPTEQQSGDQPSSDPQAPQATAAQ